MVGQVITDYLKDNRRLVIPELGAFLKKEDGSIVFVPFLNKNDGVLCDMVSKFYKVSAREADPIISQYVLNIENSIADNGYFFIKNLGSLKIDTNGILYLDTTDPDKAPVQKQGITEEIKETIVFPQIHNTEPKPQIKDTTSPTAYNKVMKGPAATPSNTASATTHTSGERRLFKEKRNIPEQPVKKKKGPDFILIISVIIAIIAIIVMVYSYFLTKPTVFPLN
ncbi:MAG: hypothetical protein LIO79_03590 [Rikenellaceae bacterium]|nr:hypothetical protein [Rikenellaceae bacterium]